jgi:hypothetical protein
MYVCLCVLSIILVALHRRLLFKRITNIKNDIAQDPTDFWELRAAHRQSADQTLIGIQVQQVAQL